MTPDELRALIRLVEESDIDELEISRWGRSVRIVKRRQLPSAGTPTAPPSGPAIPPQNPAVIAESTTPREEGEAKAEHYVVESPMVGTFYRAPARTAPKRTLAQRSEV